MSKNDDGHSPTTCNYNECKAESDKPCPFLRDSPINEPHEHVYACQDCGEIGTAFVDCKHEWRELNRGGFYCVYCRFLLCLLP